MPKGMTPKERQNIKNKKSIRKVASTLVGTMGMGAVKLKDLMLKEPRKIKTDGRITKEDMEKYMKMKPREYQTGIPRQTKGPMQARPLPMTPELIKKAKDKMVPNPRAQQRERDRSKPIIGIPMRRSSARRK